MTTTHIPLYGINQWNNDININDSDDSITKAANAHRIVRRNIQQKLQPNMKVIDICNTIENDIVRLLGNDDKGGVAFPTGLSINNVVAHDTANVDDQRIIKIDDVIKIDIGTHVNGMIIDSAFTVSFNPKYEQILNASKDATETGIKLTGIDVHNYEISTAIKETIESYEYEDNNKIMPIYAVRGLGGHNIKPYQIHGGELIMNVPLETNEYRSVRLNEGYYAIETFASTGTGNIFQSKTKQSNHYMALPGIRNMKYNGKLKTISNVFNWIKYNRGIQSSSLAFCPRWIDLKGVQLSLNELARKTPQYITELPVLEDIDKSYCAQYEHTIFINENGVKKISGGDDY